MMLNSFIVGPEDDKREVSLPTFSGDAAIMVSGGLDSAVLLWWLAQSRWRMDEPESITVYTVNRMTSPEYASRIIDLVEMNYYGRKMTRVLDIDNSGSAPGTVLEGIKRVMRLESVKKLYTGINQNPPVPMPGSAPVRIQENPYPDKLVMPFLHLHKTHIIDLAYKIGAYALFPRTHSCTELPHGECNVCFQCNERKWGFTSLNRVDPLWSNHGVSQNDTSVQSPE